MQVLLLVSHAASAARNFGAVMPSPSAPAHTCCDAVAACAARGLETAGAGNAHAVAAAVGNSLPPVAFVQRSARDSSREPGKGEPGDAAAARFVDAAAPWLEL